MSSNQYFNDANLLGRCLRFLNLLEPGHMVLSLSKLVMWITLGLLIYAICLTPDNLLAVFGALGSLLGGTGNYMYRRYTQIQQGVAPYPQEDFPDGPFGPEPYEGDRS